MSKTDGKATTENRPAQRVLLSQERANCDQGETKKRDHFLRGSRVSEMYRL